MSVKDVSVNEGIPTNKSSLYDFKNGNVNLGVVMGSPYSNLEDQVNGNYLFVNNRLKSGSYTFKKLDLRKVQLLVENISRQHGTFSYSFGNAKLVRIYESPSSRGFLDHLYNGNSVQLLWSTGQGSTVVLRVINTNSDLFGIWGWLTYYDTDYYQTVVRPKFIRNLQMTQNADKAIMPGMEDQ